MRYVIRDSIYGAETEKGITLKEYRQLKDARRILSKGLAIEEKYDVLLSNYKDFENEILNISTEAMLYSQYGYDYFRIIIARMNKRLINFLTSSRLYIDHIKQHVNDLFPLPASGKNFVQDHCSNKYVRFLEYRFMEELRNYVQHCEFPIHYATVQNWAKENKKEEKDIIHSIDIFSVKSYLKEDDKFKRKILSEIEEKVNLKTYIRKYVECLSEIHAVIRNRVANKLSGARKLIEDQIASHKEIYPKDSFALIVFSINSKGAVTDEFPLLLKWDDIRIDLEKKNRIIKNQTRRYVSGEVKEA